MGLLFLKTSPVKQYSYENGFSGVFDALHQSFLVITDPGSTWSPPGTRKVPKKVSIMSFARMILNIWARSWDYGTYHVGDQRRLRRAHMKYECQWMVQPTIRHLALLGGCACVFEECLGRTKSTILSRIGTLAEGDRSHPMCSLKKSVVMFMITCKLLFYKAVVNNVQYN